MSQKTGSLSNQYKNQAKKPVQTIKSNFNLDDDFIEQKEQVKKEVKKQTKVTVDWGEEE